MQMAFFRVVRIEFRLIHELGEAQRWLKPGVSDYTLRNCCLCNKFVYAAHQDSIGIYGINYITFVSNVCADNPHFYIAKTALLNKSDGSQKSPLQDAVAMGF